MAARLGFKPRCHLGASGGPLLFSDDRTLLHVVGNTIAKLDVLEGTQETLLVGSMSSIGTLAVHQKQNVVCFSENMMHPVLRFADLDNSSVLNTLSEGADVEFQDVAFSADGTLLASLSGVPDFELTIWDWTKGEAIARTKFDGQGSTVSFNPSSNDELCVSGRGALIFVRLLVDQEGNVSIDHHKVGAIHDEKIDWQVHAWDNANQVYCGSKSGQIWKFDATSGNTVGTVMHVSTGASVRWLQPRGQHLICCTQDGVIRWFDVEENEECYSMPIPPSSNNNAMDLVSAALSTDGTMVAAGMSSGAIFLVHLQSQVPPLLESGGAEIQQIVRDDVSGFVGLVQHDDVSRLTKVVDFHAGIVSATAPLPQTEWIVTSGHDGVMRVFSAAEGTLVFRRQFPAPILTLTVCSSRQIALGDGGGVLRVVELPPLSAEGGKPRLIRRHRLHRGPVTTMRLSPSSEWVATAGEDGFVNFVSTQRGERDQRYNLFGYLNVKSPVRCLMWHRPATTVPEVLYIATAGREIWRVSPPKHGMELKNFEYSPDMAQVTVLRTRDEVTNMAISNDYIWCTSANSKKISAYPLTDPAIFRPLEEVQSALKIENVDPFSHPKLSPIIPKGVIETHAKGCTCVSVSDTGHYLLTGAGDGFVHLFELDDSGSIPNKPRMQMRAHSSFAGGVTAVGFTADNSHVVACGADGLVMISGIGLAKLAGRKEAKEDISWANRDDCSDGEDDTEPTVIEAKFKEMREVEEAVNAAMKNTSRASITALRAKLQNALAHNEEVPELEKLQRNEFIVDIEAKEQMEEEGRARVRAVEESIRMHNLGKQFVWQRVKDEVWDAMEQVGGCATGFESGVKVFNFPIRKLPSVDTRLARIKAQRRIEIAQARALRKEFQQPTSVAGSVMAHATRNLAWGAPPDEGIARLESPTSRQLAGGQTKDLTAPASQEADAADLEEGEGEGDAELLDVIADIAAPDGKERLHFSRLDVTTRERRIMQASLVREEILEIKARFNKLLHETVEKKREVVHKVEERNVRIREIQDELKTADGTVVAELKEEEIPEKVLSVDDSEVTAERPDDGHNQAAGDENKAVDKDSEEAIKRALRVMMGGTLDSEKEIRKLDQVLIRPEWMDEIKPEDMTDEQQKAVKEFETANKALQEEKDKYRKTLESEMKKLRAEQTQLMQQFDEMLQDLSDRRFDVEYTINKLELYIIKLLFAVHKEEELTLKSARLEANLVEAVDSLEKQAKAVADHKVKLDRHRELYDQVAAEDKALERQLRREIADAAGEYVEVVRQSFGMRPEADNEEEWLGEAEPCPFGVDEGVWQRMLQGREAKMESEARLREAGQVLNTLQTGMQELQEEHDELERRLLNVQSAIQSLKEDSVLLGNDLDLVVYLKQGQLEVEQQAVVTDYSDGVMVDRAVVEQLNGETRSHGAEKVAILKEIKEFRKGIHKLAWENRCLDLEEDELVHRIRDLQLLRVTKSLQTLIKGGEQSRAQAETASLEKLMEYQLQLHADKVAENKRTLDRLESQARETLRENDELDEDVQALESAVVERDRLCELHGSSSAADQKGAQKTRMKIMVTHRKLLDLAKAQTREIELMREELVRLRARTFPSFAQLHDNISFPDEA